MIVAIKWSHSSSSTDGKHSQARQRDRHPDDDDRGRLGFTSLDKKGKVGRVGKLVYLRRIGMGCGRENFGRKILDRTYSERMSFSLFALSPIAYKRLLLFLLFERVMNGRYWGEP